MTPDTATTRKREMKAEEKRVPRQAAVKARENIKDFEAKLDFQMYGTAVESTKKIVSVMLAYNYDPQEHKCKGWLMSEKLDGVRCYWNGKALYTRNGNEIFAPDEWVNSLPKDVALDGELWSGRDQFQSIVSTVKRHDPDPKKWSEIKYMIFDAPLVKGNFAQRLKVLEEKLKDNKVATLIKQVVCKGDEHLYS